MMFTIILTVYALFQIPKAYLEQIRIKINLMYRIFLLALLLFNLSIHQFSKSPNFLFFETTTASLFQNEIEKDNGTKSTIFFHCY